MNNNKKNIKTYKYDEINKQHELILADIIKSEDLKNIVNSLKISNYTNFHTGHLEFNLEYTIDKDVKSEPYKINLLGKDDVRTR